MQSETIKAFVRVRPFLDGESPNDKIKITADQIQVQPPEGPSRTFRFDSVMGGTCSQQQFFEHTCKQMISSFVGGSNVCIFCYGQTGSGKTYSCGLNEQTRDGIVQRSIQQIFNHKKLISLSFYQIYLDDIYDLMNPNAGKLSFKESNGKFDIINLSKHEINSTVEALNLLSKGLKYRKIAPTFQNLSSSRSHTVLQIETGENRLLIFDLAGSERVKKSKVEGTHLEELIKINQSLSYLGNLISAIHQKQSYLPVRVSTLNKVIASSLLRNTRTAVIATINPQLSQYQESISTLQFADRAKQIEVQIDQQMITENGWNRLAPEDQQLLKDYQVSPNSGYIKKVDKTQRQLLNDSAVDSRKMAELESEGEIALLKNRVRQLENQIEQFQNQQTAEIKKFRGLKQGGQQFDEKITYLYQVISQLLKSLQQLHQPFEKTLDEQPTPSENQTPATPSSFQEMKKSSSLYKILPNMYEQVERFLNMKVFGYRNQGEFCTKLVELIGRCSENPAAFDDLARNIRHNSQMPGQVSVQVSQKPAALAATIGPKTQLEGLSKFQIEQLKEQQQKEAAKSRMAARKSYQPSAGYSARSNTDEVSADVVPPLSYFPDFQTLQQYLSTQVSNIAGIVANIKVNQQPDIQQQLLTTKQQLFSLAVEHAIDIFNFSRIIERTFDFQQQKLNPNMSPTSVPKEQFQTISKVSAPNPLHGSKSGSPVFKDPRLLSPYQQKQLQLKENSMSLSGNAPVLIPPQPFPLRSKQPETQIPDVEGSDEESYDQLALALKNKQAK